MCKFFYRGRVLVDAVPGVVGEPGLQHLPLPALLGAPVVQDGVGDVVCAEEPLGAVGGDEQLLLALARAEVVAGGLRGKVNNTVQLPMHDPELHLVLHSFGRTLVAVL